MLNPILVPLDRSLLAECVLPHVVAMGQAFNANITLLQVLERNRGHGSAQLFDLLNWQINKSEARVYLEKIRDRLQPSGLATKMVVLEGPVAESISEYAQDQQMKLVVLSSHGQNGLRDWGLSSITHKIILSAPTSVLIVRAPQAKEQPYRRILVPLDGSWRAENVLPIVTALAHFHKSEIHIVHVVKTPEMARHMPPLQEDIDLSNRIVARNRDEAEHYLKQVEARSPLVGIPIKSHLIVRDRAAAALHDLVEEQHIDIVALSAHGHSGNHQWPYGSLVNNFILYGRVPLLIVQDLPAREETGQADMSTREHSGH
jgi:nucleotide-binding universal stress UspA family protein